MFPVLRVGSKENDAVEQWQHFLLGKGYSVVVDGIFGNNTKSITIQFQQAHGLTADGVVGNATWGVAMTLGLSGSDDADTSEDSQNFPQLPGGIYPLSVDQKNQLFGKFSYVATPTSSNPEGIKITDNWIDNNIRRVIIPQLAKLPGVNTEGRIFFHRLAEKQITKLFNDWEVAGYKDLLITFDGSYVPRFIRGSRTVLSSHAWGTAFDINAAWNQYGTVPALVGHKGSVRKLVSIAIDNGFYWGGWFGAKISNPAMRKHLDGMHFEVYKII